MSTEHQKQHDSFASRAGRLAVGNEQETNHQIGRKYFLGIAIDDYWHWPKLRNARRDMRAVSKLLCDTYGFVENDMIFLEDEGATTEKIINTLHALVRVVGKTDSLIIYYAGHGHFENDTQRGYWVPVNAQNKGIADYIQNSVIKDYLKDIPSLHTFLLSDACFSGSLFVRGYQRDGLLTAKELLQLQSRWALCSGRHNETVADGPPNGHSPFAESILDVLGKSDRDYITLDFLLEQVRNQTRANYSQLPDGGPLQFADHRRGQFVFMRQMARKPADEEAWERLQFMQEENIVQLNAKRTAASTFCDQFQQSAFVPEAIRLGKQLLHKQRYLSLMDDEFDLREYLYLFPESPYAEVVKERLTVIKSKGSPQPFTRIPPSSEQEGRESMGVVRAVPTAGEPLPTPELVQALRQKPIPENSGNTRPSLNKEDMPVNRTKGRNHHNSMETASGWVKWSLLGVFVILLTFAGINYFSGKGENNAGTFVLVQGGSFDMGCASEQRDCYPWETPLHRVTLKSYYIGRYEVTQAQWRAVMGNDSSNLSGCDKCPVEQISWNDVQDFLKRLNARTGRNYRLPTEAEWEFAARGGNESRGYQFAGSNNIADVAWYDSNSGDSIHSVGQKLPNELGLYDMTGNVWEWCQDWHGAYPSSAQTNPTGPSTGTYRVFRGGSGNRDPKNCRIANRSEGNPGVRYEGVGFRLARTP